MATVQINPLEPRNVLRSVPWRTYLELRGEPENYHVRMTYDRGTLEIMSPSRPHEAFGNILARAVIVWTEELHIPLCSLGSMTCKREDLERGFEPDKCYYVQNERLMWDKEEVDLSVDPPPDLAIEVEITRGAIKKLDLYASFGVPEVWRFDGRRLHIHELVAGSYQLRESSLCFPQLPIAEVERLLQQVGKVPETTLFCDFREWVRKTFVQQRN